jgi:hypothetical protein
MRRIKTFLELCLLAAGCLAALASSVPDEIVIRTDETWVISNLFDGQTAVPLDTDVRLAIGARDFVASEDVEPDDHAFASAEGAMREVRVYPKFNPIAALDTQVVIDETTTQILLPPLAADTEYVLDLGPLEQRLSVERVVPDPIAFSTRAGPRVTGVWITGDTLVVSFSEPMDPGSLEIGHDSVDVLWEEDGDLHSIAADMNLADYVWATEGMLFKMAPFDAPAEGWVKVSASARGAAGALLDGNGNGVPGETTDDFIVELFMDDLATCCAREDIPMPCVECVPEEEEWWP